MNRKDESRRKQVRRWQHFQEIIWKCENLQTGFPHRTWMHPFRDRDSMSRTRSRRVILLWILQSVVLSVRAYVTSTTCLSSSIRGASSFSRLMMRPEDTRSGQLLLNSRLDAQQKQEEHMWETTRVLHSVMWHVWVEHLISPPTPAAAHSNSSAQIADSSRQI